MRMPDPEQPESHVNEDRARLDAISQALAALVRQQSEQEQRLQRIEAVLQLRAEKRATAPPPLPAAPVFAPAPFASAPVPPMEAKLPPPPPFEFGPAVPPAFAREHAEPSFETRFGLHWLNRVAVVTLLFGVAFFFKLAIDNQWIGPAMRVALGIVAASLSLAAGEWIYLRGQKVFAQGLTGLGLALMYLSFYASTNFYHLVPVSGAFVLMCLTTFGAGWLALHYNAQAVAVLGLIGGFLTPVLLSTGENHMAVLAGYTLLLSVGALFVSGKREWVVCAALAFIATWLLFAGWAETWLTDESRLAAFLWATAIFALFLAGCLWTKLAPLLVVNAVVYFAASYELLNKSHHDVMGLFALALALLHGALAFWKTDDAFFSLVTTGIALASLTLACPLQFTGFHITIAWAVEAVAVVCVARVLADQQIEIAGWFVFVLVTARLVLADAEMFPSYESYSPLANRRFLTFAIAAIALWTAARLSKVPLNYSLWESEGHLALLLALAFEVDGWATQHFIPNQAVSVSAMAITILGGIYAVGLVSAGVLRHQATWRMLGLGLTGAVILKLYLYDVWTLNYGFRITAFLGLGALLLLVSFLYTRFKPAIERLWRDPAAPSPKL